MGVINFLPYIVILFGTVPLFFTDRGLFFPWLIIFSGAAWILNKKVLRCQRLAVFIIWGLVSAGITAVRYEPAAKGLPPGLKNITAVEGVLKGDGRLISGGSYLYDLSVTRIVCGNLFMEYPAEITVFARGEKFFWGESVCFEKVRPGRDGSSFSAGKASSAGVPGPFFRLRKRGVACFTEKINRVFGRESSLAEALFLGNRDHLPVEIRDKFRMAGLSHVLALSGMHLGIISFFVFFLARRVAGPVPSLIAVNVINVLYLLLAGISPSLFRAVLMFFIVSLGKMTGRKTDLLQVLFFAYSVSLMIFPSYFFSISFQLSFLALAGILILTKPLARYVGSAIACSLGAVIMTSAVVLWNFGIIYPAGIIASMVVSPLVTVYMCAGLACIFLPLFPFEQQLFALLTRGIYLITDTAAMVPGLPLNGNISFGVLLFFQLIVIVLICFPCRYR